MAGERCDERVLTVFRLADLLREARPIIVYAELADLLAMVDIDRLAASIERLERAAGDAGRLPVCG